MTDQPTFMRAEIDEAAATLARQLALNGERLAAIGARLRALDPPVAVTIARGSSDHCALYLQHLIESELATPCASIGPSIASLYHVRLRLNGAAAISISQSGRSPDIVETQRAARRGGAFTIALVNEVDSPLAREAEALAPLQAGPERSVAATKSMIAGLAAGAGLVAAWRGDETLAQALADLPGVLAGQTAPPPEAMIEALAEVEDAFVLGRGATYAVAAEAALKLKETCAIHAEAYSSAEVLHGPAELVGPGFLIVAFMPSDAARASMESALDRLAEMGARILKVEAGGLDGDDALAAAPAGAPVLAPIPMIHRFYGVAEALARRRGRDPDRPRNLHKVTETL
jgi:glucosamine--fructose-6-phosphate aminotransferase (isomerizing)